MNNNKSFWVTLLLCVALLAACSDKSGTETGKADSTAVKTGTGTPETGSTPNETMVGDSGKATSTTPVTTPGTGEITDAALSTGRITPANGTRDGVIIHISEGPDDKYRVCMALKMAEDMSKTHDVLVYFDQRGTDVVFASTPEFKYSPFPPGKAQVQKLVGLGVNVTVCEPCIGAAWKKPTDLVPGVKLSKPSDFSDFSKGRIFSLDY